MGFKILIPEVISQPGYQFLLEQGYEVKMGMEDPSEKEVAKILEEYDGLLVRNARYGKAAMEAGHRLKVIGRHGTGVDNLDVELAERLGIWIVNAPTANINAVAEHTIAFLMALNERLRDYDLHARSGDWTYRRENEGRRHEVTGQVLGLLGLGRVGALVAKKAALGLDMRVIAYDPYVKECPAYVQMVSFQDLLRNADFLSLHTPATLETKGIINEEALREMKKSAYLINCGRGELVDEPALCQALRTGELAGAALDVYSQEPYPAGSPLLSLENVLFSLHNASHSKESLDAMGYGAAVGIHKVLSGEKPAFLVNHPSHPRIPLKE